MPSGTNGGGGLGSGVVGGGEMGAGGGRGVSTGSAGGLGGAMVTMSWMCGLYEKADSSPMHRWYVPGMGLTVICRLTSRCPLRSSGWGGTGQAPVAAGTHVT